MKYQVTINPRTIGKAYLDRVGAVQWDWDQSRDNIIETANQIANASPNVVEVKINTRADLDETPLDVNPKEGEGIRIFEALDQYYRSGAWVAEPQPSPFTAIPTEGEDLKAYEWSQKHWSDTRFDWPYHADFYRTNYKKSLELRAEAFKAHADDQAEYHNKMIAELSYQRGVAQINCARLRRDISVLRASKQEELADQLQSIADTYYQDQRRLTDALASFEYDTSRDEQQVRVAMGMMDSDRLARGWAKEAIREGALGHGACKSVREAKALRRMIADTINAMIWRQAGIGHRTW